MRKRSEYSHPNIVISFEETVIHNTFIRIAYIYNAIKFIVWRWAKYLQRRWRREEKRDCKRWRGLRITNSKNVAQLSRRINCGISLKTERIIVNYARKTPQRSLRINPLTPNISLVILFTV